MIELFCEFPSNGIRFDVNNWVSDFVWFVCITLHYIRLGSWARELERRCIDEWIESLTDRYSQEEEEEEGERKKMIG